MYKTVGKFAIFYAVFFLALYAAVYFFWPEIRQSVSASLFYKINNHLLLWRILWLAMIAVNFALLPVFYFFFRVFVSKNELLAAMSLLTAIIAVVFGILGSLQQFAVTANVASLYANANDYMVRTNLANQYLLNKSYADRLFYLFSLICLMGWVGLSSVGILLYGFFSVRLGYFGLLAAFFGSVSAAYGILSGASPAILSFLALFTFLSWVFLVGQELVNKKIKIK